MRDAFDAVFPRWDGLAVAGRTDSGVHATGQVASVVVDGGPPADRLADALNAALPRDVSVRAANEATDDFHARFSARSRSYRYRVLVGRRSALEARRVLSWPHTVEAAPLQAAAALVIGQHDFRAFTPTETRHRGVPSKRVRGYVGAQRGSARAHDHGKRLPPPHGAHARRDDARGRVVGARSNRGASRGSSPLRGRTHRAAVGPLPRAGPVLSLATIAACASGSSCSTSTAR